MLKTSNEIREDIQNLRTEAEAILAVATTEERELTADEQSRFDSITDQEKGEILALEKSLDQAERREQFQKEAKAARKLENRLQNGWTPGDGLPGEFSAAKIPARARAHKPLVAFESESDAYAAGQVCLAGLFRNERARAWCNDHGLATNVMTESSGPLGGFLVPDEMNRALVRLREERGVFERYARTIPMGSDNMFVPREISDVTAYWVGEGIEITASDDTIGAAELTAKKLACLVKVSTELDEDAVVDIGEMLTRSMAYKMADKIDEAGFNGDGTSTYGGVVGLKNALNASAIQDAAASNDSALTLDLADFEAAVGKFPQYEGANPVWFVHSAVYWASMVRLMNAGGGNTVENLGNGPIRQFLGYPVVFAQVLPSTTGTLASTIVAYFGDLGLAATVGTRRNANTQISLDRYFENDLIGVKCTQRVAINVHERGDSINTRPIIALKTAS